MRSSNITTTGNFRVEDITFNNARRQSEILKEGFKDESEILEQVPVPKSMTPEQLIDFYSKSIQDTTNTQIKRVYTSTIRMIKELVQLRKENVGYKIREMQINNSNATPDDIQEINKDVEI